MDIKRNGFAHVCSEQFIRRIAVARKPRHWNKILTLRGTFFVVVVISIPNFFGHNIKFIYIQNFTLFATPRIPFLRSPPSYKTLFRSIIFFIFATISYGENAIICLKTNTKNLYIWYYFYSNKFSSDQHLNVRVIGLSFSRLVLYQLRCIVNFFLK